MQNLNSNSNAVGGGGNPNPENLNPNVAGGGNSDPNNAGGDNELELVDEENDWEWEAEPAVWNRVEEEDPLDFHEETIDNMVEGLDDFYEYMNVPAEEGDDYPQYYIVDRSLPQPVVQISDEPHVFVLNTEDLWGKADLVTVWVDGEEPTVNKAMVNEGLIKSDNFWDSLEEENLWNTLEM
ncbi:hypothetical protein RHSIM_Rhsim04G0136000 [Rhododendron simsii]|uniref:Uncharacterized protein n=1 Tax=Rhododendron simsii TaxID=118357 RepID=A0A834HBJ6_RHOSS|nr:hypothetical protein RHSIM_Rhsim04G0136000 [Rhododendron simsii]